MNQIVADSILKKLGHTVDIVENGIQCIEYFKQNKYDIILMDVQMPEMDGIDAAKSIRDLEKVKQRHIPIIALTAYALKGDREKCIEAGMDDYLSKPIKIKELSTMVEKWGSSTCGKETKVYIERLKEAVKCKNDIKIEHYSQLLKNRAEVMKQDKVKRTIFKAQLAARKKQFDIAEMHLEELMSIYDEIADNEERGA